MPHSTTLSKSRNASRGSASAPHPGQPSRSAATRPLATRLTPRAVAEWEARLGAGTSANRARPAHYTGAVGTQTYGHAIDVRVSEPEAFQAMRFSRELTSMATFCALQPAMAMERTAERVRTEPMDALVVTVSGMRGQSIIRQGGREYTYGPGELVFVNNSVPYTLLSNAVSDPSGLLIPIARLGKHRQMVERMQRPVAANTPLSRAAAVFVRRFAVETSVISPTTPPASSAEQAAVDLVLAALSELEGNVSAMADSTAFVQESAAELIERHHRDPLFSPDSIAEHLHLSRRQLYRYFENCEKSLASRIADRRLESAVEMLVGNSSASISAVAAASGFPTVATFRNRFKARFGVGPIEYRHSLRVVA